MSAKLLVFAGVPPCGIHLSGGEASLPSQEYFAGIGCPSEKAVLVIWRFITFLGLGLSAPPAVTTQPSNAVANNRFICAFMARFYSVDRECKREIRQKKRAPNFQPSRRHGWSSIPRGGIVREGTRKRELQPSSSLVMLACRSAAVCGA